MLVQVVGAGDPGLREARIVEHLSRLLGQVGKVAGVQADADVIGGKTLLLHPLEGLNGIRHALLQGVIGVDEERAGGGIELCVGLEGLKLAVKAHDPAVGMGAHYRDIKQLAAEHVGGAGAAADDGRSCAVGSGIRSLGAAQAELHNRCALGRMDDAGGLCRDQTLVVDDAQDRGLHELCLHDGRHDFDEGLPREDQRPFRNAVHIPVELEVREVVQKVLIEDLQAPQVLDVLRGEVQLVQVFHQLLHAAHDGVAAPEGVVAEKRVKDDGLVLILVLEIALHHGQLIEIREQSQVLTIHSFLSGRFPAQCARQPGWQS